MTVVTVKYKITVWKKQDWSLWDFTEQNKKIDLKKMNQKPNVTESMQGVPRVCKEG